MINNECNMGILDKEIDTYMTKIESSEGAREILDQQIKNYKNYMDTIELSEITIDIESLIIDDQYKPFIKYFQQKYFSEVNLV